MNNNTSEETLGEKRRHTITITGEVRRMKRHQFEITEASCNGKHL